MNTYDFFTCKLTVSKTMIVLRTVWIKVNSIYSNSLLSLRHR